MNCRIWKSIHCFGRAFVEKTEAGKRKTTDCHSAKLIRYQRQAAIFKWYTVLISKHQSLKLCRDFPVFLLVIFIE